MLFYQRVLVSFLGQILKDLPHMGIIIPYGEPEPAKNLRLRQAKDGDPLAVSALAPTSQSDPNPSDTVQGLKVGLIYVPTGLRSLFLFNAPHILFQRYNDF